MKIRRILQILAALMVIGSIADVTAYNYRVAPKKRKRPRAPRVSQTELDPLRVLKLFTDPDVKIGPNVVIALDTSPRMLNDFNGDYYDPVLWDKNMEWDAKAGTADPKIVAANLGVATAARYYRRVYRGGFQRKGTNSYTTSTIEAIDETEADYSDFFMISRMGMARDGLAQSVEENLFMTRVGLVRMRIGDGNDWPNHNNNHGNEKALSVTDNSQKDLVGDLNNKTWRLNYPFTTKANIDQTSSKDTVMVQAQSPNSSATTLQYLQRNPDENNSIRPWGQDENNFEDSPLTNLLIDTKKEVERLMDDDVNKCRACRNTAVLLVTAGGDGGKNKGKPTDPSVTAAQFMSVTVKGVTKRVPIYVIAVGPKPADIAELQSIATASGGEYFETYHADEIAWAANRVMQSVQRRAADFDVGKTSDFQTVSPIVGTVNLRDALDINGQPLPNTSIGLTQNSNVVLTSGFTLPGYAASLRAFRTFKPVADATQKTGYKFVNDGKALWVGHMPGAPKNANVLGDSAQRNIYTYIPGQGMVPFIAANAATLRPYLQMSTETDATDLIAWVRDLPIGPIISSTPAIMNPPSLAPAPDTDYSSFAGARSERRTLVFVGANDGMLHAFDGRTGVEVWAFIPTNLLPKMQTLVDNQPVHNFEYMMDSSPKVADVKVNGAWRTYLMVGQGAGGTFYQTFDVSDAGLNVSAETNSESAVIGAFTSKDVIPLKWSFPRYSSFDPSISTDITPYGDLGSAASAIEKTVGETWSDPAVGQLGDATGRYAMIVGSGFLSTTIEAQGVRASTRAGSVLYVLDVADGSVLSSYDAGDDAGRANFKNAFQADPTAIGPADTRFIDKVYIGDTEGYLWRFAVNAAGTLSAATKIYDAKKEHPIYASLAVINVSGSNYIFLSTGIDTLPKLKKVNQFVLTGLLDSGAATATKKFEIKLEKANNQGGDERPTSSPAVAGDIVFFTTTTEIPDQPCTPVTTTMYALTFLGGPAYDSNGDNLVNASDQTAVRDITGRSTAAFVSDQHLFFGSGTNLQVFGDPEDFNNGVGQQAARVLSWREVR